MNYQQISRLGRAVEHDFDLDREGVAPAMTALVAGQVDLSITNLANALPPLRQGKVKVLAVTQPKRFDGAPSIPSIIESLPGFDLPAAWYGFFGPPNLPRPIVARLSAEIVKALESPEVKDKFTEVSMSLVVTTSEPLLALIRETASANGKVIQAAGVRLE